MEQVLSSILLQIYPDTQSYYIEYWKRQEWHHILAHADMDEGLQDEQDQQGLYNAPLSHPETGHVLYLQLVKHGKGPTVVWNTTFGGDMISP
jgi:hypothetical protein